MKAFKFICPSCQQKVEAEITASGRQFACPGCRAELIIPPPPQQPGQLPEAILAAAKPQTSIKITKPEQATDREAIRLQPAQAPEAAPPRPDSSSANNAAAGKVKLVASDAKEPAAAPSIDPPSPASASPQETTIQIASLTPAIKRDMLRSIRRRLADEAHWMPGVTTEGKCAYAAKDVEGQLLLVEATSPEATRFSILGASLAELQLRNVTRTATGRMEFLDQELFEAIREAAGDAVAEREAGAGEVPAPSSTAPLITHAQSMKALDLLEKRYTREIENPAGTARARPEDLRLADLTRKMERKETVAVEEVCAALANELREMNERLTALERSAGQHG